jgi:HAD superfamily hydrolase (TIGR01509 family)
VTQIAVRHEASPAVRGPDNVPGYALPVGERQLEAVLFDMDGTLVDSEKLWQRALEELAATLGAELPRALRESMVGATTPQAIASLYDAIGQPWRNVADGARWLDDRVMTLFKEGMTWRPGAQRLLAAVRGERVPTALVTATERPLVEVILGTIGRENFDVIVTDDDVTLGKPHPEPYASAAAALGVPTANCVAIEDSPTGVASALAAGCVVVAVPAEVDLSHVAGVTHVASLTTVDVAFLREAVAAA